MDLGLTAGLARSYAAITRGLYYPGSEGDSIYLPFHVKIEDIKEGKSFQEMVDAAGWWQSKIVVGAEWLSSVIDWSQSPDGGNSREMAARYRALRDAMNATLVAVWRTTLTAPESRGFHPTRHYLFGQDEIGGWAGIVTYSIET